MSEIISTTDAPAAIGPYSQAIKVQNISFLSGQIPLDPKTGALVGEGDTAKQTEQVMKNLLAVVKAAGHSINEIVRCTIFLSDLKDFNTVNEIYGRYLEGHRPARATVEVSRLPKDVAVEIDAICISSGA